MISFTDITGDSNPIHRCLSAAKAQGTLCCWKWPDDHNLVPACPEHAPHACAGLPGCVLPGMLCASLFPAIIGSAIPGALYVSQMLKFRRPAMVRCSSERRLVLQYGTPQQLVRWSC